MMKFPALRNPDFSFGRINAVYYPPVCESALFLMLCIRLCTTGRYIGIGKTSGALCPEETREEMLVLEVQ